MSSISKFVRGKKTLEEVKLEERRKGFQIMLPQWNSHEDMASCDMLLCWIDQVKHHQLNTLHFLLFDHNFTEFDRNNFLIMAANVSIPSSRSMNLPSVVNPQVFFLSTCWLSVEGFTIRACEIFKHIQLVVFPYTVGN